MTPELKAALDKIEADNATLTASLATIAASVAKLSEPVSAANLLPKVEPHAVALEGCANAMEAAGIGTDSNNGHAVMLRKMADNMRAEAAQGRVPSSWSMYAAAEKLAANATVTVDVAAEVAKLIAPISASIAAMTTAIADVKASARTASQAPERKSMSASSLSLLARAGLQAPTAEGEKIPLDKLDAALKEHSIEQRLELKTSLRQAGLLA